MNGILHLQKKTLGKVSLGVKLKRVVWNVTAVILFRPFITPVFRKWRILVLRLFGAKVAWDANVYASVKIWAPWMLKMGHRACLGPDVICYNQDWVVLEDDAIVSQYSYPPSDLMKHGGPVSQKQLCSACSLWFRAWLCP